MSLQVTTNINVDFYDKKYIMLNAKQYDGNSRWIAIACYNEGSLLNLNNKQHTAYIRYKKADGHIVFKSCRINFKNEVLVELTEQMLAADGICYADLMIVNKGTAIVDIDTGKITTIDNSPILSTMAFCINVYETAFDNSLIESLDDFSELNKMITEHNANYTETIQLAKSYAVGDAQNIRENENFDNSKYYSQLSKSYAIGDANGLRVGEDIDNSKYYSEQSKLSADNASYYYELVKTIVNGLNSGFIPMGTISFSELATVEKATGFTYNIKDDFVTDESFREGVGMPYTAGTNVYYTADGYWDCFGGSALVTATVDETKNYLGI